MNPRLVAIAGPLKGMNYALSHEEVSIGRESSNRLCIGDLSVSRRHCLIKREGEQFKICDLESLNGSFVNGLPVKERVLEHGDRVAVGDSLFLFLLDEGEASTASGPVKLDEGRLVPRSTVQLRREDALYLKPEEVVAALPQSARLARDFNALLRISKEISSIRGLDTLQRRLLELIFEVVPARRGAILFAGENLEGFASVFAWDRLSGSDRPVRVSSTIVRQVLREGIAILSNDVVENEAFFSAGSLVSSQTTSLLCVPLLVFEKVFGVLYLDTADPETCFDGHHLQWLTAVASMAAVALENSRHLQWLEDENRRLQAEISIDHNMVGDSSRMKEVHKFIARVARTESTVLIVGESGTGKELVARAIHLNSPRADAPFVAINCATLTETLLESELFGHEKGAFTGATAQKRGKLEFAEGGTLFLDEVAELAPLLQAKLLRVLQEREFERVGGTRSIKVDIRVITATNKDLEQAIRAGTFRQDLYYRLNVVSLTMPPLRERRDDIPLLAGYFAAKYSKRSNRKVLGVSPEARTCLMRYEWPGNVRELENAIERAVVLGSTGLILPEDLPESVHETEPSADVPVARYHEALQEAKKQLILKAVEQSRGNYTEAAKLLGVHPNYLHRLIRNMNLKPTLKK